MNNKYILKILFIIFFILIAIILLTLIGSNINEQMEGFDNNPLNINSSQSFCNINKGAQQETSCNALTKYNCGLTSCCIWTSDNKCKAGNQSGPLFNSDSKGKTIPLDYYYFENQCYGPKCSSS
jgi:hypothetical protein